MFQVNPQELERKMREYQREMDQLVQLIQEQQAKVQSLPNDINLKKNELKQTERLREQLREDIRVLERDLDKTKDGLRKDMAEFERYKREFESYKKTLDNIKVD